MKRLVEISLIPLIVLLTACPLMALEEPKFEVLEKKGDVEIRRYAPYLVAEVMQSGSFEKAGSKAHDPLFDYISGENVKKESIEMAVPVNQSSDAGEKIEMAVPVNQSAARDGTFRVSFVLPSRFSLATAPQPLDDRVKIREVPARKVAVIRYSGTWSRSNYDKYEKQLMAFLREKNLTPASDPVWARYNPPWTPWFMRRNEIQVEIE